MNWSQLITDFSAGKPDAIQAIFSILGFVITLLGTLYVAITFHQQKKINKTQEKLNIIALEKDRRELLPYFIGINLGNYAWDEPIDNETTYELKLSF
jgi:cbb3-type cytochrome oxidase subunit 3